MRIEIKHGRVKGDKPKPTFGSKKPYKGKDKNRKGSKKESNGLGYKVTDLRIVPKHVAEPKYIKYFHEVLQPPCFVCGGFIGIEFHHVKEHSTDERIDSIGMALCHEHHHGTVLSPHGTPVKFKEVYPMSVQFKNAAIMYTNYEEKL